MSLRGFYYEPPARTLTLFHGTWSENLDSIRKNGLLGYRREGWAYQQVNAALARFGFDRRSLPKWAWEYEVQDRGQRGHVIFFTTDWLYAWVHCWAGFELEYQIY